MGLVGTLAQLRDTARVLDDAVRRLGVRRGLRATYAVRRAGQRTGAHVQVDVPGLPQPIFLRSGTSDAATFVQIFLRGDLDFPVSDEPTVIVDGGANIGLSSLYLHKRFPKARIVAVEFETSNFALLVRNVASYPSIVPVHAGLWPHDGQVEVANTEAAKWAHFPRAFEPASGDGIASQAIRAVRAISMQTLLAEHRIDRVDLLKLDIEGSEHDLFEHESAWLDSVATLAIELHERVRPGSSRTVLRALAARVLAASVSGEYLVCELGGRQ